jgi:ribosome maturation factor RimP
MGETSVDDLQERFIRESGLAARISELAEPVIKELGMRLVRVKISAQGGTNVQIMADRPGGAITVDDCALISRRLSPVLDASDPIPGGYVLEVSSPGIARLLVRPSDFEDWAGFEAKIELTQMIDGRRRFRGVVDGYENGEVRLRVDLDGYDEPQVIGLPVAWIGEAKLVMTESLLERARAQSKAGLGDGAETDIDGEHSE